MAQPPTRSSCGASAGTERCVDCTDIACALRALVSAKDASGDSSAACSHPRSLRWSQRLALALRHPQIHYRLPSALAVVVFAADALGAHGLRTPAWIALALAGLLGLWWSAPRAKPAGWGEFALLAAATAVLATGSGWNHLWPVVAVALGLATSRLHVGSGVVAWTLSTLASVVGSVVVGAGVPAWPILGLTAGAAVGLMVSERRTTAARERRTVAELLEAVAPSAPTNP